MRGGVVVAGRAQDQAGPRPVEEEPDADDQRQREVDEGVLAEQDAPDQRDIGEAGNIQMRRRRNLLADEAGADQAGKADAENGQREAGGDLVDRKPQRHQREDQRHQHAGDDAAQRADDDRAGEPGAAEAAGRADDHHALDAEVEHAGAFGHELAGRSQQQRRGGRQHRKDDGLNEPHGTPLVTRK